MVYDDNGVLSARIHPDYEKLDQFLGITKKSESGVHRKIEEILEDIRKEINSTVSHFSRIKKVIEQKDPFVKTPTKKIKRYLYVDE
jgi:long-chain acyl-CoA synthetase